MPKYNSEELRGNEPCGCGSGKLYRYCHKRTNRKYFRKSDNTVYSTISLPQNVKDMLKEREEKFHRIFGREMEDNDLFFEEGALGRSSHFAAMLARMEYDTDIRPELLFASIICDRIVTHDNLSNLSSTEKKEWTDTVRFYLREKRKGVDPFHIVYELSPKQYEAYKQIKAGLADAAYVLSSIYRRLRLEIDLNSDNIETQVTFSLWKVRDIALSFDDLVKGHRIAACDTLSRAVFESALRIAGLRFGYLTGRQLVLATLAGSPSVPFAKRKNGRIDYNKVIDPESGLTVDINFSYAGLVRMIDARHYHDFFDQYYRTLSMEAHGDHTRYILDEALHLDEDRMSDEVGSVLVFARALYIFLDEVNQNDWISERVRQDLQFQGGRLIYWILSFYGDDISTRAASESD